MEVSRRQRRACLSIFIYGETNKQFRACVNIVYGKTSKIKENALSRYPRQANCNVNRTKTYDWISSKLTPVDASHSCAFFCIFTLSCVDLNLCAIAVSLPWAANLSCIVNSYEIKILKYVSNLCVASETNVVSKTFAGQAPLEQVFRKKAPSARTQKVILNEILYYIYNPGMNLLRNTLVEVRQGSKNLIQKQLYRYD